MLIAGLQKTSTLDFPGRLAAVIFTPGCNYRCFYCHNRHILEHPPLIAEEDVSAFLEKRQGLLDGVVFSGGEPTLQKDIAWWMNRVKKLGYDVKLDTNGSRPQILSSLLSAGLIDYVAMDYKAPQNMYGKLCLAPANGVFESMRLLESSNVEYELRTTLVPQLTYIELCHMAEELPVSPPRWALQLYRPQEGNEAFLNGLAPYTPGEVQALADKLKAHCSWVFARC